MMNKDSQKIQAMFSTVAPKYDFYNRLFSLGLDVLWRKALVQEIPLPSPKKTLLSPKSVAKTATILDLAAGTLDVSCALRKQFPNANILATDFCKEMLYYGLKQRKFAPSKHIPIYPIAGDAFYLPFKDNSFDAITVAFGLRNMRPQAEALAELFRVTRRGGSLHILEFSPITTPIISHLAHFYIHKIMPFIVGKFDKTKTAYSYLASSIDNFSPPKELEDLCKSAGYTQTTWQRHTFGLVAIHRAYKQNNTEGKKENEGKKQSLRDENTKRVNETIENKKNSADEKQDKTHKTIEKKQINVTEKKNNAEKKQDNAKKKKSITHGKVEKKSVNTKQSVAHQKTEKKTPKGTH